ncbi:polynucleotide adenylyltransferase PcnB [Salinibius halmophilus]|uniref:polynucleotide adenylyltransferase PcnB n=1 Tax=Salinibius halmophilus TaxID=1853216 RepID=UPI000E66D853|nr:polynucleotide adenylyltransferase PcnB [Salinibius halmophilus]
MAKSLINKIFGLVKKSPEQKLITIGPNKHGIQTKDVALNARKVLSRLQDGGYDAYLVGGGVRDTMLGLHPKDFDVATNATPEQVKSLFRNSRIIGRRFRLVHVRFGREIIEVATFRGSHDADSITSDDGMLLRDNVWGSMEDDAFRRDFTINALYYSLKTNEVTAIDGALNDMKQRVVRIIGDPETRYREDPVRMLRAVRFAGKLGFTIDGPTQAPFESLANLLQGVPAARMFDEVIKLLMSGQGVKTYQMLVDYGLIQPIFPHTYQAIADDESGTFARLIEQAIANTDERIAQNKPVTPAFLYAALLWPAVSVNAAAIRANGTPEVPALHQAAQQAQAEQSAFVSIPKRFGIPMREIWDMQPRLVRRGGKRAEQLVEHPRFRAAYDFLVLRESAGEETKGLGEWWTSYQQGTPELREKMRNTQPRKPRRRKRRKTPPKSA